MFDKKSCDACLLPRVGLSGYCQIHTELSMISRRITLWWDESLWQHYCSSSVENLEDYYQLFMLYLDAYTLGELDV